MLGILPGMIGVIQANETVKLLTGLGEPLLGRLLLYDALNMTFKELKLGKDPACPMCGENPSVTELIDYDQFCGVGEATEESAPHAVPEVSPTELKAELDAGDALFLLDVREPHEVQICTLQNGYLLPLGELEERLSELDREQNVVVYCRSGVRSITAVQMLQAAGFSHARNLTGGVLAWSDQVDPSMPKY